MKTTFRAAGFALFAVWAALGQGPAAGGQDPAAAPKPAAVSADPRFVQAVALLEAWIDAKLAFEKIPGISLGFVLDQDLVWSKGYGFADLRRREPATPRTIYSICSISKLFTSIAVLKLRDEGKLRLDDPVAQHLPWFKLPAAASDSPAPTLRDLLTHSAGVPRESDHPYWAGPDFMFPTREDVIGGLANQSMLYPAERYFQYSNLGMALLGQVVEQASGLPYGQYVRENILAPLGLTRTTPEIPAEERGKLLAQGYGVVPREGGRADMPFFQARGIAPAAGFASNVEDLARFASWQFRLLAKGGFEVLKASTLREMQRVHWMDPDWKTSWGLGFAVFRQDGKTLVGHEGDCPGFRTALLLLPDERAAGVAMINAMGVEPGAFAGQAVRILGDALRKIKEAPEAGKQPDPSLSGCAGLYRAAWGETAVVVWDDGLAMLDLPSADPLEAMDKLKRVEGLRFRRLRADGELGEDVVFEADREGRVIRFKQHGNYTEKVR
jgi:CubicO group peptidase (beta-lactamase class C family)